MASTCWSALGRSPCPGASIAATVNPSPDPSPATARRARDTSPGAYLCRPPPWPIRSRGAPSVADSGDHSTPLMSPSVKVRSAMPSEAVVEVKCRVEEGVVFMGVAFRELPVGRSRWRLPQSRDRGLQGSTHCGYCVHGSHLLPMDHDRRDASTPATRCATGIMPVAVSLSNPPTATPSSVMSRINLGRMAVLRSGRDAVSGLRSEPSLSLTTWPATA